LAPAPGAPGTPPPPPPTGKKGRPVAPSGSGNEIDNILLVCRSVNLDRIKADAHTIIAEAVAEELRSQTNYFVPDGTKVIGEITSVDVTNLTFTFNVAVKLAHPVKL
jgi:hypothetical protein